MVASQTRWRCCSPTHLAAQSRNKIVYCTTLHMYRLQTQRGHKGTQRDPMPYAALMSSSGGDGGGLSDSLCSCSRRAAMGTAALADSRRVSPELDCVSECFAPGCFLLAFAPECLPSDACAALRPRRFFLARTGSTANSCATAHRLCRDKNSWNAGQCGARPAASADCSTSSKRCVAPLAWVASARRSLPHSGANAPLACCLPPPRCWGPSACMAWR